jgi:UDP-N-acetylglucosamine--N-acetylmuramyl-(pentapeptide) pyrophosphoryl-undecaprenol N-acetylglucosamine transferase
MGISKAITKTSVLKNREASAGDNIALRIVFAGGGTGGHLFPGIAIAEAFMRRQPKTRILFVSSGKKIEETVLAKTGFEKKQITIEGIKGKRFSTKMLSLMKLPRGLIESICLIIRFQPDVVIGMGAYSAGPVVVSAWMLRVFRVIHEQNSIPGITNRLLADFANRIYVSFADTQIKARAEKIVFTGNPVRKEILDAIQKSRDTGVKTKNNNRKFDVLILGGSQGAQSINMAVVDALKYLKNPGKYRFTHQTGAQDVDHVQKAYSESNMEFVVAAFFEDMATRYQNADLVICRSGATTVAELAIAGSAVIFIPFPFATDNHQVVNTRALVENGAAEIILEEELSGLILSDKIQYYAGHPDILEERKARMRQFGKPDAAERIVDDIYRIIGSKGMEMVRAA